MFRDGALLAVLAQLGAMHREQAGWWFAEFVAPFRVEAPGRAFPSIDAFGAWLRERLD